MMNFATRAGWRYFRNTWATATLGTLLLASSCSLAPRPVFGAEPAPQWSAPPALSCPTRAQLCPGVKEEEHKPLPPIKHSISVRYCDRPVVVWVMIDGDTLIRFDALNPPSKKDFPKVEDFVKWLDTVPHDVYDLPCVGENNQKGFDPGNPDPGSHAAPPVPR